jgi:peroxiredoxin
MVYETVLNKVKAAAEQLGVRYPIVQDNGFEIWKRYGIWAWPTTILIDKKGIIRYGHVGEGAYEKTEALSTSSWQKETLRQSSGRDRA